MERARELTPESRTADRSVVPSTPPSSFEQVDDPRLERRIRLIHSKEHGLLFNSSAARKVIR
jgi:hypothetical protein